MPQAVLQTQKTSVHARSMHGTIAPGLPSRNMVDRLAAFILGVWSSKSFPPRIDETAAITHCDWNSR